MDPTSGLPAFSAFALDVAGGFSGLSLKQADGRIADARHILWASQFSGFDPAEVAFGAELPGEALALALRFDGEAKGDLMALDAIILEVRVVLFVQTFGIRSESRFGAALAAFEASRRQPASPEAAPVH